MRASPASLGDADLRPQLSTAVIPDTTVTNTSHSRRRSMAFPPVRDGAAPRSRPAHHRERALCPLFRRGCVIVARGRSLKLLAHPDCASDARWLAVTPLRNRARAGKLG